MVTSNGVCLVIACSSWKQHATVNYAKPMGYNMSKGLEELQNRLQRLMGVHSKNNLESNKRGDNQTVGVGRLWDDVQSIGFYCSQGLDPSALSFLQTSVFYTLHWLD